MRRACPQAGSSHVKGLARDAAADNKLAVDGMACDIVVAGGGIAGLTTALRLQQLPWTRPTRIMLIDVKDRYVFQPLLIDYAVSDVVELDDFAPTYKSLLSYAERELSPLAAPLTYRATLDFLQANISSIDNANLEIAVLLPEGHPVTVRYESMILSPGLRDEYLLPGQPESSIAQRFATLDDAEELRERLDRASKAEKIAVVGGNYVGVELAVALAEQGRNVTLFAGSGLLKGSQTETRQQAELRLRNLSVDVRYARVKEICRNKKVHWQSGDQEGYLDCSIVLVSGAGQGPAQQFCISGSSRRLSVDSRLQAAPQVFCLGDAAASGAPLTGQAAIAEAEVAAWNAYALRTGLPTRVWRKFKNASPLGEFVALGREDAAGAVNTWRLLPSIVPSAIPFGLAAQAVAPLAELAAGFGPELAVNVSGASAAAIRRLAYLYRLPTLGHRAKVAARWARRLADWRESKL